METRIIEWITRQGPVTGAELRACLHGDPFALWQTCMKSTTLEMARPGRRYLRLDNRVDGYARLSPSILREFLTYSVIGLKSEPGQLAHKARELAAHIRQISEKKRELARCLTSDLLQDVFRNNRDFETRLAVLIAGDVVYEMAHDVPRPERSTGKMVAGSDLDLVFILDDDAPDEWLTRLDEAVYEIKYRHLVNPAVREEVDYVVKKFGRFREQVAFDTFKGMVACKIMHEAELLHGSLPLFFKAKALLAENGVIERLNAMREEAEAHREQAEQELLNTPALSIKPETECLFYPAAESEEFE